MPPRDLRPGQIVTNPAWEHGDPVRILQAVRQPGGTAVRYQDINLHHHAVQTTVRRGKNITLVSGGGDQ